MEARIPATQAATRLFWPYLVVTSLAVLWAAASNVYSSTREVAYLVSGIFPLFTSLVGFLVGENPGRRSVPQRQVVIVFAVSVTYLVLLVLVPWVISMQLGDSGGDTVPSTGDGSSLIGGAIATVSPEEESQAVADRDLDQIGTLMGMFMGAVVAAHARLIGQQKKEA